MCGGAPGAATLQGEAMTLDMGKYPQRARKVAAPGAPPHTGPAAGAPA